MRRTALLMLIVLAAVGTTALAGQAPEPGSRNRGIKNAGGKAPVPTTGRFRVFILSGQSNMVGQGLMNELTDEQAAYRKPHDRIRVWYDGRWEYLVPERRFGPEVSLAHELANAWPQDTIGIIKVAVGGTGILAFVPDWKKEEADLTGDAHKGPIYEDILASVRAARKVSEFDLAGFVWKQGGKDTRNPQTAKDYLKHFTRLVEGLRKDTGAANLPVFIGTHLSAEELAKANTDPRLAKARRGRPALLDVLRAQNAAAKAIPHCRTIVHGSLPVRPDGIHFNTEGQLTLGRMFAKAILEYYRDAAKTPRGDPHTRE